MPSRLAIEFPDLEIEIAAVSPTTQRRIAVAVARDALKRAELAAAFLTEALERALAGQSPSDSPRITKLVEELDRKQLELGEKFHENGSPESDDAYDWAFRQARAANAVLYALTPDSLEAAREAAYETHHVLRDSESLRRLVRATARDRDVGQAPRHDH